MYHWVPLMLPMLQINDRPSPESQDTEIVSPNGGETLQEDNEATPPPKVVQLLAALAEMEKIQSRTMHEATTQNL